MSEEYGMMNRKRETMMKLIWMMMLVLTGAILNLLFAACDVHNATEDGPQGPRNYRQDMRNFVVSIRNYAAAMDPGFIVIPQNGQELITTDSTAGGALAQPYVSLISGQAREDLYYGYTADNVATPAADRDYMLGYLDRCEANAVQVLVIDYCSTHSFMDNSYAQSFSHGFISFAADHRDLDNVPNYPAAPYNVSADNITTLGQARNFLYLINPNFADKQTFLNTVAATNHDAVVVDLFFWEDQLTQADVNSLRQKANGGTRLVICYMSIGEAENYRYYWQPSWATNPPSWLGTENPDWPGNFKVEYWQPEWQAIMTGNDSSYTHRIVAAGFDGVYLDLVDAFDYFENLP